LQRLSNMTRTFYNNVNPEEYELRYMRSARENYLWKHWCPEIESLIRNYCKNKLILDLGCGTGFYTRLIKRNASYTIGLDLSRKMLKYAQNKSKFNNVDFILADAHQIPLKVESVDVIICLGLFEYVQRRHIIKEIKNVMKRNGFAVIQVPNKYSAYRLPAEFLSKFFRKKYLPKEPSFKEMLYSFHKADLKLLWYKIDDGLIFLPNLLDRIIGNKVYCAVERMFKKVFGINPFSDVMLFLLRKSVE
jgi:ubiquinone/menaquinone biosynthesis C-methylase UbiE